MAEGSPPHAAGYYDNLHSGPDLRILKMQSAKQYAQAAGIRLKAVLFLLNMSFWETPRILSSFVNTKSVLSETGISILGRQRGTTAFKMNIV